MKVGMGLALAGGLLLAAPTFAQSVPGPVRSGAMPDHGIYNAQTAGSDFGGMPASHPKHTGKAHKSKMHQDKAPKAAGAPSPQGPELLSR
jgi:hypothetical protein